MSSLLPVLLSLFGVLGGALVYAWQKVVDRRATQRAELKDAYIAYLMSVEDLSTWTPEFANENFVPARMKHNRAKKLVLLLAPKDVLARVETYEEALLAWHATCFGGDKPSGDQELMKAAAVLEHDLIDTIRKDLKQQDLIGSYVRELVPFLPYPTQ